MKLHSITIMLLMAFLTISCNNSAKQNNAGADASINLNQGTKWKVNAEMVPFILEGEKVLESYAGGDYKSLSKQLEKKNSGLIKSCSMKGESHDELHKWLHPHMALVEALGDADNEQEANEIIADLKKSFQTYHTYFQ